MVDSTDAVSGRMLKVSVENSRQRLSFEHAAGPLEFGRGPATECERCIVEDLACSRNQLRVTELTGSRVRLVNLSSTVPLTLSGGRKIPPGEELAVRFPVQLVAGATRFQFDEIVVTPIVSSPPASAGSPSDVYSTVAMPVSRRSTSQSQDFESIRSQLAVDVVDTDTLIRWFETVVSVQQAAATSVEFYDRTARAVVDLVGLDEGLVIIRSDNGAWAIAARHGSEESEHEPYSTQILDFVLRERRTFFSELNELSPTASLANVSAAVASPIFGADHETVVGVVYGRRGMQSAMGHPIRQLEAHLVQVLASAVGAGLQRMEKEAEASRWRVQLESFFTPRLVAELDRNPNMLKATERVVTILFADIRGFTDCTARLDAADALDLVGNVMTALSDVVHQHDGVIVDYYGDGLMAMWNAPIDQPDHANRATNTALDMLSGLPGFGGDWERALGRPLQLGIGINTGPCVVGNVGSERKFKYGALGLTVNLAQRIESVTKLVGFPSLCSGATRETVHTRAKLVRIGLCLLSGALHPTELHIVLHKRDTSLPSKTLNSYEAALEAFERGDWATAANLVEADRDLYDIPLGQLLLRRAKVLHDESAGPEHAALDLRTK